MSRREELHAWWRVHAFDVGCIVVIGAVLLGFVLAFGAGYWVRGIVHGC